MFRKVDFTMWFRAFSSGWKHQGEASYSTFVVILGPVLCWPGRVWALEWPWQWSTAQTRTVASSHRSSPAANLQRWRVGSWGLTCCKPWTGQWDSCCRPSSALRNVHLCKSHQAGLSLPHQWRKLGCPLSFLTTWLPILPYLSLQNHKSQGAAKKRDTGSTMAGFCPSPSCNPSQLCAPWAFKAQNKVPFPQHCCEG